MKFDKKYSLSNGFSVSFYMQLSNPRVLVVGEDLKTYQNDKWIRLKVGIIKVLIKDSWHKCSKVNG